MTSTTNPSGAGGVAPSMTSRASISITTAAPPKCGPCASGPAEPCRTDSTSGAVDGAGGPNGPRSVPAVPTGTSHDRDERVVRGRHAVARPLVAVPELPLPSHRGVFERPSLHRKSADRLPLLGGEVVDRSERASGGRGSVR